jgi:hypothetical protein
VPSLASRLDTTSRWGLLPVAIVLASLVASRLGAVAFQRGLPRERLLFGAIALNVVIVAGVRSFGLFGGLSRGYLLGALCVLAVSLALLHRDRRLGVSWRALVSGEAAPIGVLAAMALLVAGACAYFLPVWQWDSLGYHLPYVNFALQNGTLADVPPDVPYLSTYPHGVESLFIAWRAMLPDDRLVDAAQIPLGLLGAASIGVLARGLGARADHAVAAGLLWLTLPAVFLQLPTNYVDIGSAAFLLAAAAFTLASPEAHNMVAAGLALGLFLASKPNAPIATALMFALLAARGWKAGRRASIVVAAACAALVGGEAYVVNLVRHGNPIWPVRLSLGPISLPGTLPMSALLESGAAAPRLAGILPWRIVRSWTALDPPPVFDMRYGGLGIVFLASLPAAVAVAVRRRAPALAVIALATLASPDPSVPRYILAFPGLVLALAAARVSALGARSRYAVLVGAALVAAGALVRAYPGLTGEGPPLQAYLRMSEAERLRAVGANGSPAPFFDALDRLGPDDVTAFDASFDLPYLAWPPDLSRRAVRIPDDAGEAEAKRIIEDARLRLLVIDDHSPVAIAARAQTDRFKELFHCRSASCIVFMRM